MGRTRLAVVSLQGETAALGKAMSSLDERCENLRSLVNTVQGGMTDVQHRAPGSREVEAQVGAIREELRKETAERRSDDLQLAARVQENKDRLEWAEQQRVKAEHAMRTELMETKAGLKKEVRDRELVEAKVGGLVREEGARREEAFERETRLRKEGEERLAESLQASIREERR